MQLQKKEKILVAMSGGVDSSVAAGLLKKEGYTVAGAYMKNWINEDNVLGNCPWQEDIDDARAVAEILGIEFRVVNLMDEYKSKVVHYLLKGYKDCITPNPDVLCNKEIKFGAFLNYALDNGFDAIATGHYARTRQNEDLSWDILEGSDPGKDQSYFLALLSQHQVKHTRFPIGNILKAEVRGLANKWKLPNATKKDSQGICFIGEIKMSDFLKTYVDENPGNIISQEGKVLGKHRGLHYFTLGQRKGIGIASNSYNQHYVVVEKRSDTNELVIAFDSPDVSQLYARKCRISSIHFVNKIITEETTLLSRPRYRSPAQRIRIIPESDTSAYILYDEAQRGLSPGQICALYDENVLMGGGFFEDIFTDTKPPANPHYS